MAHVRSPLLPTLMSGSSRPTKPIVNPLFGLDVIRACLPSHYTSDTPISWHCRPQSFFFAPFPPSSPLPNGSRSSGSFDFLHLTPLMVLKLEHMLYLRWRCMCTPVAVRPERHSVLLIPSGAAPLFLRLRISGKVIPRCQPL